MVRHKARWMLVRVDFEEDLTNNTSTSRDIELSWEDYLLELKRKEERFPSRKDITIAIRDGVLANFGVAASAAAYETHVRFHDVAMRTLMIRVPRDFFAMMRATITMMTVLGGRRVALVVLKVNGSARTTKRTAIQYTERFYRDRLITISKQVKQIPQSKGGKDEQKKVNRLCQRLEETIATIHDIE